MVAFTKILFPVSLTQISPQIVPYVLSLAKQYNSEIHLLHVAHRFDMYIDTVVTQKSKKELKKLASNFEKEFSADIEKKLEDFKKEHFKDYPNLKATMRSGLHYKEILAYVEDQKIDLIVMGTGKTMYQAVFGSVTNKVTKLATIPVMLIKTGQ